MFLEDNEENYAVSKFELMLRENNTLFFDVDEFEDITSGRLTKKEIDNYKKSLRI